MTANPQPYRASRPCALAARFLARLALLALVWLGLNGADWSSWIVGGPAVFAAAWISATLVPDTRWHWSARGTLAFCGFFLRESLRGGWDVACRALSPKLALSPAIVCVPVLLPPGAARVFFCGTINLLPGTAVIAIAKDHLCVHVLDYSPRVVEEELRELERRVAALFDLAPPGPQAMAS